MDIKKFETEVRNYLNDVWDAFWDETFDFDLWLEDGLNYAVACLNDAKILQEHLDWLLKVLEWARDTHRELLTEVQTEAWLGSVGG